MSEKKNRRAAAKTVADFLAELESDPVFQASKKQREAARLEMERQLTREEQPIVRDLAAAGVEVASVWDLVNTRRPYPVAIPVLIEHLQKDYSDRTKEGIARALTVREAKGQATQALIAEFERSADTTEYGYKMALANALDVVARADVVDALLRLAKDPRHGAPRRRLVRLLARFRGERVREVLRELTADKDEAVAEEAQQALRRLR